MITLDEVMPLVLEASPAFAPELEAYYRRYDVVPGSRPFDYVEAGQLNRWLYRRLDSHETECFPAMFALIERLLAEGTNEVKDLAVAGILEGLQNRALYARGRNGHAIFLPWLGPLTRKRWDALIEGWGS